MVYNAWPVLLTEIKYRLEFCSDHLTVRSAVTKLIPTLLDKGGWVVDKSLIQQHNPVYKHVGAKFEDIFKRDEVNNFYSILCRIILKSNPGISNTTKMIM